MKSRMHISSHTFAWTLILMFLLSLTMGTTVWGAKPPGTPDRFKTWDLKIWIGVEGEDIVLTSPDHGGEDGIYLFAEDYPCSGGLWDLPPVKGSPYTRGRAHGMVTLLWPDCGTYQLASPLDEYYNPTNPTIRVAIQHSVTPSSDYWNFYLCWNLTDAIGRDLQVETNNDLVTEGTLSDEGWLVEFNDSEAMISTWYWDGSDYVVDWRGEVSFTVKITRSPHGA